MFLLVIGTSIWLFFDARSLGIGKRQMHGKRTGVVDAAPWVWFLGSLALWIVVFPLYLVKRTNYKHSDAEPAPERVTRVCPFCAEEIQRAAIICKHCRSELGAAPA
jgi:hypothetical protein